MSWRMLAKPPTEKVAITYSAPPSASPMSVVARAVSGIPRRSATCSTTFSAGGRDSGSRSYRTNSASASAGALAKSTVSFGVQWVLPPPTRVILAGIEATIPLTGRSRTGACPALARAPHWRVPRTGACPRDLPYSAAMSETRQRTVDHLEVRVHLDSRTLARAAADRAATALRDAVEDNGVAHAMFATGNSQLEFVDALVSDTPGVPWSDIVVFHMDEYVGVGPDHPAGFQRWIRERISDRVHPRQAHFIDGMAEPEAECKRYAGLLRRNPLDICCLGIGENGHLAFNDPPVADFDDPLDMKVVELDRECRLQQVHEGHFPDIDTVPRLALTATIPALLRARTVLAIVPEARKATPSAPPSRARCRPRARPRICARGTT